MRIHRNIRLAIQNLDSIYFYHEIFEVSARLFMKDRHSPARYEEYLVTFFFFLKMILNKRDAYNDNILSHTEIDSLHKEHEWPEEFHVVIKFIDKCQVLQLWPSYMHHYLFLQILIQ